MNGTATQQPLLPSRPSCASRVPDFRSELIDFSQGPIMSGAAETFGGWDVTSDRERWIAAVPTQLSEAQLWWIGRDVVDLAKSHSAELPMDTTLTDSLVPDPYGLMVLEAPFTSITGDGDDLSVWALSWGPSYSLADAAWRLSLSVWGDIGRHDVTGLSDDNVVWCGATDWAVGSDMTWLAAEALPDWQMLLTVLALAEATKATTTATEAPDRAARRRLNRKGHPVDATRVLYLRGSSTNSRRDGDSRTYSHRWVVDGHWRSQPYGPGRRDRRPVFIAPYIKGPAGAPMLSGEKVIAFMRPDRDDPT